MRSFRIQSGRFDSLLYILSFVLCIHFFFFSFSPPPNQELWNGKWILVMAVLFLASFLVCLLTIVFSNKGGRGAMPASIGAWRVDFVGFVRVTG